MAFEQFWSDVAEHEKNKKPVPMVKATELVNKPALNKNVFLQTLDDIPAMDDETLRNFIHRNFDQIMNNVFVGDRTNEHVRWFIDIRFLDTFIDVIQRMSNFRIDIVVKCNTICYDYLSLRGNRDKAVERRMIAIGNIINRHLLPRLHGLGLSPDLASIILIARNSNLDIELCVKRVNLILVNQPKTLMTQEMVTEIFKVIYNDPTIWANIFCYFMTDVIPEYDERDPSVAWVTESVEEVNSVINLVILEIINTEPEPILYNALYNYAATVCTSNKPIRFKLQSISDDYYRIKMVADKVYRDRGFVVL